MSIFWYPIYKFVRNLLRRPLAAATSLLSLFLLFLLFDLVWVTALTVKSNYRERIATVEMELFFDDALADSSVALIREQVQEMEGIASIDYISKDAARQRLDDLMGADLLEGFDDNPLPRSLTMYFQESFITSEWLDELSVQLDEINGITDIYYPRPWLKKIELTLSWVDRAVWYLGVVILVAAMLQVVHAIRLSVRVHEEEIRQMRLMGAGNMFQFLAFMYEGKFYTLISAVAGWVAIYYGIRHISFQYIDVVLPSLVHIAYMCIGAAVAGYIAGFFGARRSF